MELSVLDDIKKAKLIDSANMLKVVEDFPAQCEEAIRLGKTVALNGLEGIVSKINSIVVLGMGGSGISGDIIRALFDDDLKVPFLVNKNYGVPKFVSADTLVFAVSYSGDTEETLSGFDQAVERNCKVIGITTGGKLAEKAESKGLPVVRIPSGIQPRSALGYLFFPLLVILARLGFIPEKDIEIEETIGLLRAKSENYGYDSPLDKNSAKALAARLYCTLPVVYGFSGLTDTVAFRWKCQFNENSKIPSFWHVFPELNHNETVSWEFLEEITKNFSLILLRDKDEPQRLKKRIDITKDLIEKKFGGVETVWAEGKSKLAKMLSLIYLGDFVSVYLALLYGVDPSPVERISVLKKRLAES
jgi:glucose/mannose-6-phosphate isomerase